MKAKIAIIMGSLSDMPVMNNAKQILDKFNLRYEVHIYSAHRSPIAASGFAKKAAKRGIKVIIAGAGGAAHLPGVIASYTNLPVIGIPIYTKVFQGIDSVLSILQMPSGVPVATMAVGKAGAKNAAVFAAQILAVEDSRIAKKLAVYKKDMAALSKKKNAPNYKG